MADLDSMLNDIISREGGFVNDPADHGGATNMGITQATLSAWLGRPATIDEVKAMTADLAKAIYSRTYFITPRINQLPEAIQPVMLDAAINSGPGQAIRFLQQVLNDGGYGPLTVDGGIGPMTVAAATKANAAMGTGLIRALVERRRAFLQRLAVDNPSQQRFQAGWMARCDELETQYA